MALYSSAASNKTGAVLRRLVHCVVAAILEAGGHGKGARSAVTPRARGYLAYLHRREKVTKSGSGKDVRWVLA
jgi:hypothetical protein